MVEENISTQKTMLELEEAMKNLTGWYYSNLPGSDDQAFFFASKVHHLSVLVLIELQDKTNGSYEPSAADPEEQG